MSKYKVGDIVKLRDDLRIGKKYGSIMFTAYKNEFKNEVIKITEISEGDNIYSVIDEDDNAVRISDEMIEGLWEECKPKLRLIDILNKIANGELKEGTKVKIKELKRIFTLRTIDEYGTELDLFDEENDALTKDYWLIKRLNDEVELIEPHQFREDTKMIEPTDNTKIEELDADYYEDQPKDYTIRAIINKLNEVINKVNAQTTVVLAQGKDIEDIKEQLDY